MTVLFVVATITLFLAVDWISRRLRHEGPLPAHERTTHAASPARTPDGIFFTPSHTWLNLFPSGKVRLGIDDFISRMVDSPEITLLKQPGETVRKGDPLLLLREEGHNLTVRSPIDADVLTVNSALATHPESLKGSLFSDGWAYTLKPLRFSDLKLFSLGPETRSWMRIEFGRLRDFFAASGAEGGLVPAMLQDGGPPVAGAMKAMDEEVWHRFEEEFLGVYTGERTGQ
jgi:glycine cleavage system H lipoate-binding protein